MAGTSDRSASCHLTDLIRQLAKFWEVEECTGIVSRGREDLSCEEHYVTNTKRGSDGRYTVRLPFRDRDVILGDSKRQASRRYEALQRKLNANSELQVEYSRVMQDYLDRGHMSLVKSKSDREYFLPHHPVIKPTSTTTKVRVVFDASLKTDQGRSLNESLLIGPSIQPKLFTHLLYIRTHQYVVMADIEQMYRQIFVDQRDRRYQRVLWQVDNRTEVFELNTVTFGVSAAPFLAIRTLHQLADDEQHQFPFTSVLLKNSFYVDDFFFGADTLEEVSRTRDDMIELLKRGGFHIRKWASNHRHALDNLEQKDLDLADSGMFNGTRKALGISWNAIADEFLYSVHSISVDAKITKRIIVSEISKVFDPLGLLGPVMLALKILIQDCWKLKLGWDETVPQEIHFKWQSIAKQLPLIRELRVPRLLLIPEYVEAQIHGFCDASQVGYGACLYVRTTTASGLVRVRLACAKSRVSPVKQLTIPRLELCGAVLLTRLFDETRDAFKFPIRRVVFWSDSQIVLYWLRKQPQALKVFEANRVAEVQRSTGNNTWRHVPGVLNPADALSRGQTPSEFLRNE